MIRAGRALCENTCRYDWLFMYVDKYGAQTAQKCLSPGLSPSIHPFSSTYPIQGRRLAQLSQAKSRSRSGFQSPICHRTHRNSLLWSIDNNQLTLLVSGLWEEARVPGGSPRRHLKVFKLHQTGFDPGPSPLCIFLLLLQSYKRGL